MKMRRVLAGILCVWMMGMLSACQYFSSTPDGTGSSTGTTITTTTRAERTTTALPTVGYIHYHATVLRSGAGLAYKAVDNGGLAVGTEVAIISRQGDWYQVQHGDVTGYVSGQFLRFTPWDPDATTTTADTTSTTGTATTTSAIDSE